MENNKTKKNTKDKMQDNDNNTSVFNNLDTRTKIFVIFMTIITFGIFLSYLNKKIEKQKIEAKDEKAENKVLKISTKIPFDINKLVIALGTEKNLKSVDASLNALKIECIDKELVKQDDIKKLGAKGLLFSENKISIIFGDYTLALKDELLKILKIEIPQPIKK